MRHLFFILLISLQLPSVAQELSADDYYTLGMEAWTGHNYEEALKKFDQALLADPGLIEAYLYRASTLEQLGKPERAIVDYMIYLQAFPDQAEVLLSASVLHYRLQQYEQARDGFQRLTSLPPGSTSMVYYRQPVHGEGITGLFTAQTENKSFLYNYLGLCEEGLGNLPSALHFLDTAIILQPDNPDYYINRGNIHKNAGLREKAEADYRKALELDADNGLAQYNLAHLLESSGDNASAIAYYTGSIEDNPSSPLAYRQRGYRLMLNGNLDEALNDFDKAISLDPENAETLVNRGIILNAKRRYEAAITDFGKAIDIRPDFEKAYFNRGNSLYHLKEYENALNDYNVALIYHPEYGQALYMRALTNYYLENHQAACEDIRQAAALGVNEARKYQQKVCQDSREN